MKVSMKLEAGATTPTRNNESDAGWDLYALKLNDEHQYGVDYITECEEDDNWEVQLYPGGRILVHTGVSIALQPGWEVQVRSRSGLTLKTGMVVGNSPGTVDAAYRGDVGVILVNTSEELQKFSKGDRIAQMVFKPVYDVSFDIVDELDKTDRGTNGFGSSGK